MPLRHGISSSRTAPRKCRLFQSLPTAPRCLWHHRARGPGSPAWEGGTGQEWERLAGGRGAAAGHCPAPRGQPWVPAATPSHPAPTHCRGTEEPFSPRREQRGHLSPSVTAASTGTLSPRAPLAGPSAPRHQLGLSPQPWVTMAVPGRWHLPFVLLLLQSSPGFGELAPSRHSQLFILLQLPRPPSSLPLCFHGFIIMTAIFWHLLE